MIELTRYCNKDIESVSNDYCEFLFDNYEPLAWRVFNALKKAGIISLKTEKYEPHTISLNYNRDSMWMNYIIDGYNISLTLKVVDNMIIAYSAVSEYPATSGYPDNIRNSFLMDPVEEIRKQKYANTINKDIEPDEVDSE